MTLFLEGVVVLWCMSLTYAQHLGPGNCLASRIDVIPCSFRFPKRTKAPGPNEYGIYNTKFREGTSGLPVCDILRNKHVIRKITALGDKNRVFILYSPGITLDPGVRYGNQMLVNYSVQCPEGDLAFLNITTLELEEPNCNDIARKSIRCVDYVLVDRGQYGTTESCGSNAGANQEDLEFGNFTVLFRTSPKVRHRGFIASIICFNPELRDMVGCTRPEGSEEPTTSSNGNRRKRELQEFGEEWKNKMQHLRRVRRQVDAGEFEIRFIERNVAFGINVTYSDKKLNFITVENNSIIESMSIDSVDTLFTFDGNGQLDVFKESAKSDSGAVLLLPGPGPMFVVGSIAYFQLFVIDPRGLVPTMEEMLVIANLTEAQIALAREDNSSRLPIEVLNPPFNDSDIFLPFSTGRRRRRSMEGKVPSKGKPVAPANRRKRQSDGDRADRLSDDSVLAAIQNENACNPVLRSSARSLLQEAEKLDPGRVAMLREALTTAPSASGDGL